MDTITKISRLLLSCAAVILAVATVVFAMRFQPSELHAVGVAHKASGYINFVFTQSADGRVLYHWEWDGAKRKWMRYQHEDAAK